MKSLNDMRLAVEAELDKMSAEEKRELEQYIDKMEEDMARQRKINDITPAEWDAMAERGAKTQALWEAKMNATEEKVMQQIKPRELYPEIKEGLDALSKQEGGSHYKSMKIQPVEFITANELGFLEGNVVKYICRHHAKNGSEDIRKAIHYCELLLQTKYGETK